jgi:hypothetical protein
MPKRIFIVLFIALHIQNVNSQNIIDTLDEEYLKENITLTEKEIIWSNHEQMAKLYNEFKQRNNDDYLNDLFWKRFTDHVGLSVMGGSTGNERNVYADYAFNSMILSKLIELKVYIFLRYYIEREHFLNNHEDLIESLRRDMRIAEILYEDYYKINLLEDLLIFVEYYMVKDYNKLFE